VAEARAEKEAGMARAEAADITGWDRKIVDQAIAWFAKQGHPFSANDLRPWLPDVRTPIIGSRFGAASTMGVIRMVGDEHSTKRNTHAKRIGRWIGVEA
jgi:transposase InsO family protein